MVRGDERTEALLFRLWTAYTKKSCMYEFLPLKTQDWFQFLDPQAQELCVLSFELYKREGRLHSRLYDYSFVLFPLAKAYEGFLKKYLHTLNLLSDSGYHHAQFRIGRSLNPDISNFQRDQWWLYDDVERLCGKKTARDLWQAWVDCRNHVFHYFAGSVRTMTLDEVGQRLEQVVRAMQTAMECRTNLEPKSPV